MVGRPALHVEPTSPITFNLFKNTNGLQGSGGQAMNGGTAYVDTVTAPDPTTVVFNFKNVFTPGLYDITGQDIVAEHIWKDVTDPVKSTNDNPVGTGPFTQVTVFQSQIFEVDKNPNYWQPGKPYIQGFRQPAYPGNDQANLATVNGQNDYAANFIPDIEKVFVSKDPANNGYWFPPFGATVMLYLNTTKAPFDDVNVRKAISMAIDRDQIANVAEYGYTKPADVTGLSDAYPNYKVSDPTTLGNWTTMDVNQANPMLDAAGLKKGSDGMRTNKDGSALPTYEINVVDGWSDWVSSVQIISQDLKAIGINVYGEALRLQHLARPRAEGQLRHVDRLELRRRHPLQLLPRPDVAALVTSLGTAAARTGSATSARQATIC